VVTAEQLPIVNSSAAFFLFGLLFPAHVTAIHGTSAHKLYGVAKK